MQTIAKVDFVKGDMGGNEIVLLNGDQIPARAYAQAALSVLDPPGIRGHQVGILEKPDAGGDIKAKIFDGESRGFITVCGGLTQVLCKAIVQTNLGKRYGIREPFRQLVLETDSGHLRISIRGSMEKPVAFTDMTGFVKECYRLGVSIIEVAAVKALKVGEFLVADVGEIQKVHPRADFGTMNPETIEILTAMQTDFDRQHFLDTHNTNFALFGMYLDDPTHGRVLFPHNIAKGLVEPSCGTGSVAIAIGLAEKGLLEEGAVTLHFDSGGPPVLGGPDTTEVKVGVKEGRIASAEFTHSLVEITSTGKIWLRIH